MALGCVMVSALAVLIPILVGDGSARAAAFSPTGDSPLLLLQAPGWRIQHTRNSTAGRREA